MYYHINQDQIEEIDVKTWENSMSGICVLSSKEWESQLDLRNVHLLNQEHDNIHFCKLESHYNYLFGTFQVPLKKKERASIHFIFYILKGKIIFIDDSTLVEENIQKIASIKLKKEDTLERFLFDFLVLLIDEDLIYLGLLEQEIAKIEESVLKGSCEHFNHRMIVVKKQIARFYRYYTQLVDVGENLADREMDLFEHTNAVTFKIFAERANRLQGETQILREYAMQVQDVYQSEISIRQNNVMKVLTMVTTIFLPLTLVAGWYGMNFVYMPELHWKYGYLFVIMLSILIILISLWIFKKKKFM